MGEAARRALAEARVDRRRDRRDRHHQPARDDDRLGARDRPPDPPRDRLAVPPHRRDVRRAEGRGARGAGARAHRAGARRVLLRHQDRAGCSTTCRGARRAGRAGRARLRHRRQLARCGSSPAAASTPPTPPTPRARSASTSRTVAWDGEMLARARRSARGAARPWSTPPARVARDERPSGWLPAGVPIAGIAGDQQAALFGQACYEAGQRQEHLRHRLLRAAEHRRRRPWPPAHGLLTTVAWRIGGRTTYALEGSVFIAGAAVQWLRDGLGVIAQRRRDARRSPSRCPTPAACTSCRPSSASARRTGTPTRAARSSGSRAAPRARTWCAPRWRRSPTRAATCWRPWRPTPSVALRALQGGRRRRRQRLPLPVPGRRARRRRCCARR